MSRKVLVFSASTRQGSFNARLAALVAGKLQAAGASPTLVDLADYDMPVYNGDIEEKSGVPAAAQKLHALFAAHDGVFIASPEYNAGLTPLLVNVLAWVSRVRDNGGMAAAFGKAVFALGSASPGGYGGYRGLMMLRQSLELQLGARVLPGMVAVGAAHEAFDDAGNLKSEQTGKFVDKLVGDLLTAMA